MSLSFRLGCAIWAYKDWVGELYPVGSRSGDFLQLYGQRFTTVEGNTTFYSVPDADTVKRWASETPGDFRFCPKLPRDITHQGRLQPQIAAMQRFVERMSGLGDRLGPFFAQLPPSYGPAFQADLEAFLQAWPQAIAPLSVEVRHPDWFREADARALTTLLTQHGMGRVLLDTRPIYECPDDPQVQSERKKPRLPLHPTLTTNIALVRYISHPDRTFNDPYLQEWVTRIAGWLNQGIQVYFFVHCPVEARSPLNARYFQQLLEQAGVPVPPLPWTAIALDPPSSSTQLSLF